MGFTQLVKIQVRLIISFATCFGLTHFTLETYFDMYILDRT